MNRSVEAVADGGKKIDRAPGRQSRMPHALTIIDPYCPAPSARLIVARIIEIERSRTCGAYLFVDTSMRVFVISEEKPQALQWVKERFHEFVAFYSPMQSDGKPRPDWLEACTAGVLEDVMDHISQLKARA